MADAQEPARKTSKRVVKKTVVKRPAGDQSAPTMRYGRPAAKPVRPTVAKASHETTTKPKVPKQPRNPRPTLEIGHKAGKAGRAVSTGVKSVTGAVGATCGDVFDRVRAVRLPRIPPMQAAAVVGLIIGLVAAALTTLSIMAFSEIRGTATGGGRWGSLTFVVITFVTFALGEFLLARLNVRQPRITSFLGICLTLFVILAFFLGIVNSRWGWVVVPLVLAAMFVAANRIILWADSARTSDE